MCDGGEELRRLYRFSQVQCKVARCDPRPRSANAMEIAKPMRAVRDARLAGSRNDRRW
jgi:hypothetical protein